MSDFTSDFWAFYVTAITVVSIIFCLVLLIAVGRLKIKTAADDTTGHVWDDNLREMNNPLPRWWTYMFVLTVLFAFAYLWLYPGLGSRLGSLNWSATAQLQTELERARAQTDPLYARFVSMLPEDLAKDAPAMVVGERLFSNHCAQCHGSDARGNKGFPNLTDDDWLHGGTPDKIKETITQGRVGNMPPMAAAVGSGDDVKNLAQYVLSLSGLAHDSVRAALGRDKFVVCAACHGPDGKGMQAIGSANLTDKIWLHGPGVERTIVDMVSNGRVNVMPAQGGKLLPAQIHVLTAYVWGLSHK